MRFSGDTTDHAATTTASRRIVGIAGYGIILIGLIYSAWQHGSAPILPYDDAYITYRYVENVFSGSGLVYNSGERVFGVSTPLYVIWLIALKTLIPLAIPVLSVRFNGFFHIFTALFVFIILQRLGLKRLPSAIITTGLLMHREMLDISLGGMESFMFTALITAALVALMHQKILLGAALLGTGAVCRPEGILLVLLFLIGCVLSSFFSKSRIRVLSRRLFLFLTASLAPFFSWCIFSFYYFGQCLPHSILAKSRPVYPLSPGSAWHYMLSMIHDWTFNPVHAPVFRPFPVVAIILTIAGSLGLLLSFRRCRLGLSVVAGFWVLVGLYWAGNPLLMPWYFPPLFILWLLNLTTGVPLLIQWCASLIMSEKSFVSFVGLATSIMVAGLFAMSVYRSYLKSPVGFFPSYTENSERLRTKGYLAAGKWLNRQGDSSSVASPEIGALGYCFKGKIFDACGLVTPEALPFLPVPASQRLAPELGSISMEFVQAVCPDFIITLECFASRSLLSSTEFHNHYRLSHHILLPKPVWRGSDRVLIFSRIGANP
jgi:hypothetical protein